jgi:hypothetical protein
VSCWRTETGMAWMTKPIEETRTLKFTEPHGEHPGRQVPHGRGDLAEPFGSACEGPARSRSTSAYRRSRAPDNAPRGRLRSYASRSYA